MHGEHCGRCKAGLVFVKLKVKNNLSFSFRLSSLFEIFEGEQILESLLRSNSLNKD